MRQTATRRYVRHSALYDKQRALTSGSKKRPMLKPVSRLKVTHTPLARLRSRPYADPVKILYLAITGVSDPTRASIPLHIAANGSLEAGQECVVVLAGDATELVSRGTAERVEGVGVPPVKELFQKLLDHQVPVYV
jgi:hypothetical protein